MVNIFFLYGILIWMSDLHLIFSVFICARYFTSNLSLGLEAIVVFAIPNLWGGFRVRSSRGVGLGLSGELHFFTSCEVRVK